MAKAKQPRNQPSDGAAVQQNGTNGTGTNGSNGAVITQNPNSAAEIDALNQKISKMQSEIDGLKKQLSQVVAFIKQKMK